MGLQSQIPSPVAGGTRPTVPCQDQLQVRFAVMLGGLAAAPIGRGCAAMLPCASLWAAACDPHGIPPSHGVWTRETRVEGRRRPKKAELADVVAICVQTSSRPIVVVLIPQRRDALTNSIMKGIAWLKKCLAHPSLLPLSMVWRKHGRSARMSSLLDAG